MYLMILIIPDEKNIMLLSAYKNLNRSKGDFNDYKYDNAFKATENK